MTDLTAFSSRYIQRKAENEGLQIFCNDQLVGYLKVSESAYKGNFVNVMLDDDPEISFNSQGSVNAPAYPECIQIGLYPRGVVISDYDMQQNSMVSENDFYTMMRKKHNIPSYAQVVRDNAIGGMSFRWRAAKVSVSQYEKIFDLDAFEPC